MFNRKNQIQDMDAYVEERLSDFLDGTLDDQERQIVEAHLASSERARASYESLRYTVNLLKQTPAPALPRQFTLPVTSRAPARATAPWVVWSLRGIAVAATAAFVLLLTTTLLRQNTSNQAFEQAAPMAAQAQPSLMVALAPTPLPTFPAQSQQDQMNAQAPTAAAPIMITVEPPPGSPTPQPITVAADADASKAQATAAPAAAVEAAPPPAAAPVPTNSVNTELAQPTPTALRETTDASAAGSSAPTENTPETLPTSAEAATQRTTAAVAIEGVITATRLRVRSGPGMDYPAIGGLGSGDLVKILGRDITGAWLVIEYPQNLETGIGWIGALFVDETLPIANLPVYDAPEPVQPEPEPTDKAPTPTLTVTDVPTPLPTETVTEEPSETPTTEAAKASTEAPIAPQATATPES